MVKNIRILDIALKAGVSIGTVDRVIHQRGEVSEATREKILKIIQDFDYRPNILASSLASKKVTTFASLTPMALDQDSFWSKPQIGINKAISQLKQFGVQVTAYRVRPLWLRNRLRWVDFFVLRVLLLRDSAHVTTEKNSLTELCSSTSLDHF